MEAIRNIGQMDLSTPRQKLIFAIMNLDGETRQMMLGVSVLHYRDKDIAASWHDGIIKQANLHPYIDIKVCAVLKEMYLEMIR